MQSYDSHTVSQWLEDMRCQLLDQLGGELDQVAMIGIHAAGVRVAEELHRQLGLKEPLGTLNISFYRDDFSRIGLHPQVSPSLLPCSVEGRTIILVDDVLFSGRTVRAAMNEIFDYGRPARVLLAVLVDRAGRELPIQADVRGTQMTLQRHEYLQLSNDDLSLQVLDKTEARA
jgi:pyrimidine operon attenuation protein/uracil phosphoribosyltransferase